jgi:hypothetical protein
MGWRVYYEDETTFSADDGKPWDSPRWGVVAIAQPCARQTFRALLVNGPHFLYRDDWGCWMECNDDGLHDLLTAYAPVISCYRQGRYIRSDSFKRIWKVAQEYADATQVD